MTEIIERASMRRENTAYVDQDELEEIDPVLLASERSVVNSGAPLGDVFLSQGGAGMEAESGRKEFAAREMLFNEKKATYERENGKKLAHYSKDYMYDDIVAQVDAKLLEKSRVQQLPVGGNSRRGSRSRNPSTASILSAAAKRP